MEKPSSIKKRISLLFIILMLVTISAIVAIGFYNWKTSINDMIVRIENETHADIAGKVEDFTNIPLAMNDLNHHILQYGLITTREDKKRDIYFAGVMRAAPEDVYSFSYGTEKGEYYGARRNLTNQIELMRSDVQTGGQSRYYRVEEDLTAGPETVRLGDFDPRTREWYIAAKERKQPIFSEIYKHFVMNDLALSASYPIYDERGSLQGVLGTHLLLSRINHFLQDSMKVEENIAFIVETESGELIANSLGKDNFRKSADGTMRRLAIGDFNNPEVLNAYEMAKRGGDSSYVADSAKDRIHIKVTEIKRDGLDWLIITAIPERFYIGEFKRSLYITMALCLLALLGAILVWQRSIEHYLSPIYSLIQATEKFSHGDFWARAEVFKNDEIGKLACAFNDMAQELCTLFHNLENKVNERTKQLEQMNEQLLQTKDSLERVSQTDFLTNLANRRFILEKVEAEIKRFRRTNKAFSVIMADIDYFKKVNDTYGHDGGDLVLKEVALLLSQEARESDCVSRWGGEEFLLFLPETELAGAVQLAERIRQTVAQKEISYQDIVIKVTLSLGVAAYGKEQETVDEVIKKADLAVYRGKQAGRNRVMSQQVFV